MTTDAGQGTPAGTLAGTNNGQQGGQGAAAAGVAAQLPAGGAVPAARPRTMVSELGDEALATRLARTRAQGQAEFREKLKAATGIEDPEQLAAKWKELTGLSAKEQERQRAELTELERHKADLAAERAELAKLKERLAQVEQERQYDLHDRNIQQLAAAYVDPAAVKLARIEFAEHCKSQPKEQVARYEKNPKLVDVFFRQWAKKNPRFALGSSNTQTQEEGAAATVVTQPPRGQQVPPPARRPITNGAAPRRAGMGTPTSTRPDPTTNTAGKTVRPGRTNSMNSAEVREYARTKGITYPS